MPYVLIPIPPEHLRALAQATIPPSLTYAYASDALPPDFVAARALEQTETGTTPDWAGTFYVLDTEREYIVGSCGFKHPPQRGRVEIGYSISALCRKQGAATAAVQALQKLAFDAGISEVLAEILPDNLASSRVVQKNGFTDTGRHLDQEGDLVVLWLASKSA